MKFFCLFGFHSWNYHSSGYGRRCQHCWRWEYKSGSGWIYDKLGSEEKSGKYIKL